MVSLRDEEVESNNNQKLWHIWKKRFHDIDDSDDNNVDIDDNKNDDDVFDTRNFYSDILEPDIDVDDYNDYIFDTRKFHDDL